MKNYLELFEEIKKVLPILKDENFEAASDGTHFKVFLSNKYVIRFRDDNPQLLIREADLLKKLNHPLIPEVIWQGEIEGSMAMVEIRLPGKTINTVWKNLNEDVQIKIIDQVVKFLNFLKNQPRIFYYSVNTGEKYQNYMDLLTDGFEQKIEEIRKYKQAEDIFEDLLLIINNFELKSLFKNKEKITLVHGDLIIHNLLTDGENLTGVLDWELSQFGDSDYDLCRLFYYQECAKAYEGQDMDESFEIDYMDKLIKAILESDLIKNKNISMKKYEYMRAIFLFKALLWAVKSDNPSKNILDLLVQWKKIGAKQINA